MTDIKVSTRQYNNMESVASILPSKSGHEIETIVEQTGKRKFVCATFLGICFLWFLQHK